jgi:hypothetical protein
MDINLAGTSIFGATKLVIAAGTQTGNQSTFAITGALSGQRMTIDVDQIGSIIAGQTITTVCRSLYQ